VPLTYPERLWGRCCFMFVRLNIIAFLQCILCTMQGQLRLGAYFRLHRGFACHTTFHSAYPATAIYKLKNLFSRKGPDSSRQPLYFQVPIKELHTSERSQGMLPNKPRMVEQEGIEPSSQLVCGITSIKPSLTCLRNSQSATVPF
jgi:hypothetical protein